MNRRWNPAPPGHTALLVALILTATADSASQNPTTSFDVRAYGAVGDGKTLETGSIEKTIKACSEAGGGTVHFPAGMYVTGTFELLSNVTLELDPGAVLKGSSSFTDYRLKSDFGLRGFRSGESGEGLRAGLIVANRARNIAITGHGVKEK